jgi:hypothetical protein
MPRAFISFLKRRYAETGPGSVGRTACAGGTEVLAFVDLAGKAERW